MQKSFDAVIIGAGPAGSTTAIALARRGYEVALLDKQRFPREKLCGDFVSPINWPIFQDLEVENRILAEPHAEVTGVRITSCSGDEAEAGFSSTRPQARSGLGLRRAQLDQVLLEKSAEVGATVRLGCRIEKLAKTGLGWRLEVGDDQRWQARILIGADGRNSWVAQQLGMNTRATTQGRSVGFQIRLQSLGAAEGKVEIHFLPGGYAGVVGLGDGTINLCLAIDKRKLPRRRVGRFLFAEWLAQNPHLKAILERSECLGGFRSIYPIYSQTRRCYAEGALLVGDAARVTEPVTGEGIFFAMRSALLAAETADQALRDGDRSAQALRTYEQRCDYAFRSRRALNRLLRFVIYRPAVVNRLVRGFEKRRPLLSFLVAMVCAPPAVR